MVTIELTDQEAEVLLNILKRSAFNYAESTVVNEVVAKIETEIGE